MVCIESHLERIFFFEWKIHRILLKYNKILIEQRYVYIHQAIKNWKNWKTYLGVKKHAKSDSDIFPMIGLNPDYHI